MAEAVGEQAMHLIAGVRDILAGLMARVIEDCVRTHLVDPEQPPGTVKAEAVEQLLGIARTLLKSGSDMNGDQKVPIAPGSLARCSCVLLGAGHERVERRTWLRPLAGCKPAGCLRGRQG